MASPQEQAANVDGLTSHDEAGYMENPVLGAEGERARLEQLQTEVTTLSERAIADGLDSYDVASLLQHLAIDMQSLDR